MRELSLNILDIVTNSIEAEASRVIIYIEELDRENIFRIRIRDNGRGMSRETQEKVLDPFITSRTTRSVGMGLSLLNQSARQSGGFVELNSEVGKGTTVTAEFRKNHLNRAPLGNIVETIVNLVISNMDVHFCYLHRTDSGYFSFDSFWIYARMVERACSIYEVAEPAREQIKKHLLAIRSSG
ncbi:sensor histidine kinase [candidate division KSB1 bacterium]|nr:sensor histidine kinase [candidate division KSB1 bacterium]